MADEELLTGGNMTRVVRVGNTVRRTAGPWTPTIHALLRHVRAAGFTEAPEPLGLDEQGREIIALVPGRPGLYPLPAFMFSDATLKSVARALRRFHEATSGFTAPARARWQWPAQEPFEVVCHNDWAPYNLMFEGERLTGVIDFDLASPGPRARDAGYAAYRFVPLTAPQNPDAPYPGRAEQLRRLATFCAAYGDGLLAPDAVLGSAVDKLRELVRFIVDSAAGGDPAQQAVLARGDTEIYERDSAYLERHRERLARAAR